MGIDVGLQATRFLIDGEVIGKIDGPPLDLRGPDRRDHERHARSIPQSAADSLRIAAPRHCFFWP